MSVALGYFQSDSGNVGDDLNPWLFARALPDVSFAGGSDVVIGIGSILVAGRWDDFARKIVFGSGARSRDRLPAFDESWDLRFVRGPRTQALITDRKVEYITDPAMLIARHAPVPPVRRGIGIVPYYQSSSRIWQAIAWLSGARLISPKLPVDRFIAELNGCERVLCEAMHGAIFADALRVPWKAVSFQNRRAEGDTHIFKWSDWCESVDLRFAPLELPLNPTREERAAGRGGGPLAALRHVLDCTRIVRKTIAADAFRLSDRVVFDDRLDRLEKAFRQLNRDLR